MNFDAEMWLGMKNCRTRSYSQLGSMWPRILDRQALYEGRYQYAGIEATGGHEAIL
jgi:hypothetical protein